VALFAPHVLLELHSLRSGIEELPDPIARDALFLALSALFIR